MNGLIKKAGLGMALAATALSVAAPADAQRYRGYRGGYYGGWHHHHGERTGAAVLGGIVGLGVGAAIASSANRDRYYDRGGYYNGGYYDRGYAPAYYDRGYYADYRQCWNERRYDNYGYPVRVRVCN